MSVAKRFKSRFLLLSSAIALGIGLLVTWQLLDSRAATWQRVKAANTNLLFTVTVVMERTLQAADNAISHSVNVVEAVAAESAGADRQAPGAERFLGDLQSAGLFVGVAGEGYGIQLVLDDAGRVLAASSPPPPGEWVFAERSYFTVHRDQPDVGFYISAPFLSMYDDEPSVAMSRRWNRGDGSFGGIVVQTMKLSALHALFTSFELGADSGINIFLNDGTIITRFPYTTAHLGRSLAGTANFERFAREGQGSFSGVAAIDGIERFYVFRTLDKYPVIVNVAQSTHSILAAWKRAAVWLGGATLLLMLACMLLAVLAESRVRAYRSIASRLRQAEHELRVVIDSLPVLVAYWDNHLVNRVANIVHEKWFGMSPGRMLGRHISELVDTQLYKTVRPHMDAALAGRVQSFELALPDAEGTVRHTVTTYVPDTEHGEVRGFFVLVTDISDRKAAEMELFEEKERFRIILDSINDAVITTGPDGRILYLNPAAVAMTGWNLQDAAGEPIGSVMRIEAPDGGGQPRCPLAEALRTRQALKEKMENILVGRNGERMHIECSAAPILDGQAGLRGAVVVFHEIGQVRAMANKMSHLAQHDALTGLPNRRRLDEAGRLALARAIDENRALAILYLDLDGFKQVNDEFGHAAGDELLVAVTRRMSARLRVPDALYRQGGDEFVVLMTGVRNAEEAESLAIRLIECCRAPVSAAGRRLSVTVSIGIALYPDNGADLDTLIQRADTAMYVAKNAGRNCYARVDAAPVSPG